MFYSMELLLSTHRLDPLPPRSNKTPPPASQSHDMTSDPPPPPSHRQPSLMSPLKNRQELGRGTVFWLEVFPKKALQRNFLLLYASVHLHHE